MDRFQRVWGKVADAFQEWLGPAEPQPLPPALEPAMPPVLPPYELGQVVELAILPALKLLPPSFTSDEALVMMIAAGLQESRFKFKYQRLVGQPYVKGPARGWWQFERAGGVRGVMKVQKSLALDLCDAREVPFDEVLVHATLEHDDILAAGFARLLLACDGQPLPSLTAPAEEAWQCYMRNWRPGKPHRHTWDNFHALALGQVAG